MPKSSKPRKKYKPKSRLVNPMAWVMEGFSPISTMSEYFINLKTVNHSAMESLVKGRCNPDEFNRLLAVHNMANVLVSMGYGSEYDDVLDDSFAALTALGTRAEEKGRFVGRAQEITALNTLLELHDAQLAIITIEIMDKALKVATDKKLSHRMFHTSFRYRTGELS
jgi:hypothetical protein